MMEVSACHFLSSWHPLPVEMVAVPVNGMADLKFLFCFFLSFSGWLWCEVDMHLVDAIHLHAFSLSASHGYTELFCFDIEAYPRYPLSYSDALKLSLLLTTAPIIQLIMVLWKIWISWIECFSAWLALLTWHFKMLVWETCSLFWCAVSTYWSVTYLTSLLNRLTAVFLENDNSI